MAAASATLSSDLEIGAAKRNLENSTILKQIPPEADLLRRSLQDDKAKSLRRLMQLRVDVPGFLLYRSLAQNRTGIKSLGNFYSIR